jgi:hypothetical protein
LWGTVPVSGQDFGLFEECCWDSHRCVCRHQAAAELMGRVLDSLRSVVGIHTVARVEARMHVTNSTSFGFQLPLTVTNHELGITLKVLLSEGSIVKKECHRVVGVKLYQGMVLLSRLCGVTSSMW